MNSGEEEKSVNPDELMDMVHEKRGIPKGSAPPSRPTRITHHEIKALKTTTQKKIGPAGGIAKLIGGIIGSITGLFSFLIPGSSRGSNKKTRCNLNGHVFPRNWTGDYPVCTYCGEKITSPEEAGPKVDID